MGVGRRSPASTGGSHPYPPRPFRNSCAEMAHAAGLFWCPFLLPVPLACNERMRSHRSTTRRDRLSASPSPSSRRPPPRAMHACMDMDRGNNILAPTRRTGRCMHAAAAIPGGGPAVRYTKTNQIDVLRLNNPRTRNPGPVPEEKSGARLSVDRRGSL